MVVVRRSSFLLILICVFVEDCLARLPINSQRHYERKFRLTDYEYKTKYFQQKVDHFGFHNADSYEQRYLVADQYWNEDGGPIFFYTGNEGDIAWFCNNTGFMWDIAGEFKALLVFAEHRYYGESIPYGPEAYKNGAQLNYLTSEQALADFAVLINHLKSTTPGAYNSSVIAFGGSYGGMLSAWMRIKYPNIVAGSLAASAPILQFTGITPCGAFNEVLTRSFLKESEQCVKNIRNSWQAINDLGDITEGRTFMSTEFKLCAPLMTKEDVNNFKGWLTNAWTDLAMVNYPYPANFLEPLPGWPVKEVCNVLSTIPASDQQLISDLAKAVKIYFNYTGQASCLNITQQATSDLGDLGWGYQSCTEMVMPICANGITDMFEPSAWNFTSYSEECKKQWQTTPRENWIVTEYWGKQLKGVSNIIFRGIESVTCSHDAIKRENLISNGLLDPWSSGGVLESSSQSLVPIIIPDGAHHLDLRAANPLDPPSVINARIQEKNIIRMWLGLQNTSPQTEYSQTKHHKLSKIFRGGVNRSYGKVSEMNQS